MPLTSILTSCLNIIKMSLVNTFIPREDTTEAWYRAYSVYQSLELPSRIQWGKTRSEFLISSIAFSVCLANAWRFAYVAYICGKGGMVLPYLILTVTVGLPLLAFECFLGQFTASSPVSAFNFTVIARGIGFSMGMVCWLMSIYSIMFIVYPIKYLFFTLESHLPWTVCPNQTAINNTCVPIVQYAAFNYSKCANIPLEIPCPETAAAVFWDTKVLSVERDMTITSLGKITSDKFILVAFSWGLVFLFTVSGLRGTSRVSTVSLVYLIIILFILLIWSGIQDGAASGLEYFFIPDLAKMSDVKVWTEAGTQVIMTYGLCTGGQLLLASYNRFDNNLHKQIGLIALSAFVYTLLNAVTVFSAIGHLAFVTKLPVEHLFSSSNIGLNLIMFMEILGRSWGSNLWCILFLLKEILMTLTAQMIFLNVMTSVMYEEVDRLKNHYSKIRLAICILSFVAGIACTTQGGIYVVEFLRLYVPHMSLTGIGLCQIVFLACCYGATQFFHDVSFMLSIKIHASVAAVYLMLCPVLLLMLFVANIYDLYNTDNYFLPAKIRIFGNVLAFLTLMPIPFGVFLGIYRCQRDGAWKNSFLPNPNWGPRDTVIKILYINWLRHKERGIEAIEVDETLEELGSNRKLLDLRAAMLAHMRKDILLSRLGDLLHFDQDRESETDLPTQPAIPMGKNSIPTQTDPRKPTPLTRKETTL